MMIWLVLGTCLPVATVSTGLLWLCYYVGQANRSDRRID
jgi:hypothetical protein